MSTKRTTDELNEHKKAALKRVSIYLDEIIASDDPGKADKLSYWLEDYVRFLRIEKNFSPDSCKKYKRGEIIKIHLGYNIGSEEGGLHYAVVIDCDNSKHNPILTVVPLTSIKPNTDLTKLGKDRVNLGNEIFTNLNSKYSSQMRTLKSKLSDIKQRIEEMKHQGLDGLKVDKLSKEALKLAKEVEAVEKMKKEILKMKKGSIALVGQITTVSKIRIYDPRSSSDILSGIRLSNEKLDLIDDTIMNLYIGKKYTIK